MPTTCGFPNCQFRSRYRGSEDNRHFYRVPKKPAILRKKWLDAIGRTEATIVSQLRVCSGHFHGGEKREGDIPVADPAVDQLIRLELPPKTPRFQSTQHTRSRAGFGQRNGRGRTTEYLNRSKTNILRSGLLTLFNRNGQCSEVYHSERWKKADSSLLLSSFIASPTGAYTSQSSGSHFKYVPVSYPVQTATDLASLHLASKIPKADHDGKCTFSASKPMFLHQLNTPQVPSVNYSSSLGVPSPYRPKRDTKRSTSSSTPMIATDPSCVLVNELTNNTKANILSVPSPSVTNSSFEPTRTLPNHLTGAIQSTMPFNPVTADFHALHSGQLLIDLYHFMLERNLDLLPPITVADSFDGIFTNHPVAMKPYQTTPLVTSTEYYKRCTDRTSVEDSTVPREERLWHRADLMENNSPVVLNLSVCERACERASIDQPMQSNILASYPLFLDDYKRSITNDIRDMRCPSTAQLQQHTRLNGTDAQTVRGIDSKSRQKTFYADFVRDQVGESGLDSYQNEDADQGETFYGQISANSLQRRNLPTSSLDANILDPFVLCIGFSDVSVEFTVLRDICEPHCSCSFEEGSFDPEIYCLATDVIVYTDLECVRKHLNRFTRLRSIVAHEQCVGLRDLIVGRPDVAFEEVPRKFDPNLVADFVLSIMLITTNRILAVENLTQCSLERSAWLFTMGGNLSSLHNAQRNFLREDDTVSRQRTTTAQPCSPPSYFSPLPLTSKGEFSNIDAVDRGTPLWGQRIGLLGWNCSTVAIARRVQAFSCDILAVDSDLPVGFDFLYNIRRVGSVREMASQADWLVVVSGLTCDPTGTARLLDSTTKPMDPKIPSNMYTELLANLKNDCQLIYLSTDESNPLEVDSVIEALERGKLRKLITNNVDFSRKACGMAANRSIIFLPECTQKLLLDPQQQRLYMSHITKKIILSRVNRLSLYSPRFNGSSESAQSGHADRERSIAKPVPVERLSDEQASNDDAAHFSNGYLSSRGGALVAQPFPFPQSPSWRSESTGTGAL